MCALRISEQEAVRLGLVPPPGADASGGAKSRRSDRCQQKGSERDGDTSFEGGVEIVPGKVSTGAAGRGLEARAPAARLSGAPTWRRASRKADADASPPIAPTSEPGVAPATVRSARSASDVASVALTPSQRLGLDTSVAGAGRSARKGVGKKAVKSDGDCAVSGEGLAAGIHKGVLAKIPAPKRISERDLRLRSATLMDAGSGSVSLCADGAMREMRLVIDLPAAPKERARVVSNPATGMVASYTPAKTRRFSALVRGVAVRVMAGALPISGPVGMEIMFLFRPPKSWPLWRRTAAIDGVLAPTARPDMDNLDKALLDALNGVAFDDDALISRHGAEKRFAEQDAIVVRIFMLDALPAGASRAAVETFLAARAALASPDDIFTHGAPGSSFAWRPRGPDRLDG